MTTTTTTTIETQSAQPADGPQYGTAAPLHARSAARRPRTRWRNRPQSRSGDRYLHTGIEKNMEDKTYSQAITITDRIDYLAPLSNNLGYCLAVEKFSESKYPSARNTFASLLTEITPASLRTWLARHPRYRSRRDVRLPLQLPRAQEIMKIFEYVSGQRMMTSYFRIGGLALSLAANGSITSARVIDALPATHRPIRRSAHKQPNLVGRTKGVGITLAPKDAIAMGVSGPLLRGERRAL